MNSVELQEFVRVRQSSSEFDGVRRVRLGFVWGSFWGSFGVLFGVRLGLGWVRLGFVQLKSLANSSMNF